MIALMFVHRSRFFFLSRPLLFPWADRAQIFKKFCFTLPTPGFSRFPVAAVHKRALVASRPGDWPGGGLEVGKIRVCNAAK